MSFSRQRGSAGAVHEDGYSRRAFLRAAACGALGGTWLTLDLAKVARAAHDAQLAHESPGAPTTFLSRIELADVDAIAAQIIPTDATPGAREAGVALFIDRALATFFARMASDFRSQLAAFHVHCQTRYPDAPSFAALGNERQMEFLTQIERTPFFERVRLLTLIGMLAMSKYGGNRDNVGWKLLGFQDQHVFQPPFGYYDRDYPGFAIEVNERS